MKRYIRSNFIVPDREIDKAIDRINKEVKDAVGEDHDITDFLYDAAEVYKEEYDPSDPDFADRVIRDLENEADKFIDTVMSQ
jgi:vacuolar-type H+-ATPase subunit H